MRSRWTPVAVLAIASAATSFESPARANGRFPNAGQLVSRADDPTALMVQATYGVLTRPGGPPFRWVCEQAVGYGGEQDPAIALTGDGSMLVAAFEGLSVSHDGGCTWDLATGPLAGESTPDVTVDPSDPSRVWVVTATIASPGYHVVVARSDDGGRSFTSVSELPSDLLALTIEVAPSDPDRLYVSGLAGDTFTPVLERSDDGGASFTRTELSLGIVGSPFVSGVDPLDPDHVFVRVDVDGDDALFVSDDGGATTSLVTTEAGEMLGFALSPDGSIVAIAGPQFGVRTAPTSTLAFADGARITARCLHWNADGLYACANAADGFAIGLSTDEGTTFSAVLDPADIVPLTCPAGTETGDTCPAIWSSVAPLLGAGSDGGGGAGGAGAGGGSSGGGGESGCGCALSGDGQRSPRWLALGVVVFGLVRRRASYGAVKRHRVIGMPTSASTYRR